MIGVRTITVADAMRPRVDAPAKRANLKTQKDPGFNTQDMILKMAYGVSLFAISVTLRGETIRMERSSVVMSISVKHGEILTTKLARLG